MQCMYMSGESALLVHLPRFEPSDWHSFVRNWPQYGWQTQIQRAAKGGGKLRGGGKHSKFGVKPVPKNVSGPPTYDTFSPDSLSFPLKERGTDQTNPNF